MLFLYYQSREEMEVLFALLAERYERRTVLITSNLVFSKWDSVFRDPMTTAAAVDRVVHHAVVIELPIQSQSPYKGGAGSVLYVGTLEMVGRGGGRPHYFSIGYPFLGVLLAGEV